MRSLPQHVFQTDVEGLSGLDKLSKWLKTDGWFGYIVLYSLIFVTTIRSFFHLISKKSCSNLNDSLAPMPLYSTLIVLSGMYNLVVYLIY